MEVNNGPVVGIQSAPDAAPAQAVSEGSNVAPKEEILSPKFEALARREKMAFQKIKQAKQLEQQLKAREQELEQKYSKYMALENQKPDPLTLLQQYGYSYEDATQFVLNDNKPTADLQVKSLKEELEAFKKQQETEKQKILEEQKKRAEAETQEVIDQYRSNIDEYIEGNKEEFELCHLFGGQQLIFDTAWEYFERTGKVMNLKEAAMAVEDYLAEEAKKIKTTKKFKTLFELQEEQAQAEGRASEPGFQARKTLNNQMISSSAPSMLPAKTEHERLQRAMAALTRR